jgi:hypothetical protein
MERIVQIVIACPVFEQVAEDIERLGAGSGLRYETQEQFGTARVFCAQVQVGDKKGVGHVRIRDSGFGIQGEKMAPSEP